MKPVPFAQYLARQQKTATLAAAEARDDAWAEPKPEAKPWPPKIKPSPEDRLAVRSSPLLRPVEARKPESAPESGRPDQSQLKAFEDGRQAARKELDEDRLKMREQLDQMLAQERARWVQEEGERLAQAHRAAFDAFETRCAQAVTQILRPFLTTAVIAKVTEALVENLEVLFASRTKALFEISGPADLLDALRERFADREAAIVFKPDEGIDVRVQVDDTVIETQLASWMQALGALPRDVAQAASAQGPAA